MENFKCLIVEDEPLAAEILQDYIAQVPFLDCIGTCRDAIYALQVLQEQKIDVLFLDIHLPGIKGLDFLRILKTPPQVIITTAYRDYAIDGYELNVVDYLLKPIHFNRFLKAVNKLRQQPGEGDHVAVGGMVPAAAETGILIYFNRMRVRVGFDEILYIESQREFINIVTADKSFLTKRLLSEIEEQLPKDRFVRIHRSFIVAIGKVNAFNATGVEINGKQIAIGRSYKLVAISTLTRSI